MLVPTQHIIPRNDSIKQSKPQDDTSYDNTELIRVTMDTDTEHCLLATEEYRQVQIMIIKYLSLSSSRSVLSDPVTNIMTFPLNPSHLTQ